MLEIRIKVPKSRSLKIRFKLYKMPPILKISIQPTQPKILLLSKGPP